MNLMRIQYVKMLCVPLFTQEIRRFPWSRWKVSRNHAGQVIPFRRTADGRFEAEWKYSGLQEGDAKPGNENRHRKPVLKK